MNSIESFFNEVTVKKDFDIDKEYKYMLYFLVSLGWSQRDFEEAELPFINDYFNIKKVLETKTKRK